MFKLLALRVLDGCAIHIQKCLTENVFYYFCNDYRFDVPGKIYRGSKYTRPLPADFFTLPASENFEVAKTTIININAIVGKNGDGKSSIVELMIRLINNQIAYRQQSGEFKGNQDLIPIYGVFAELYFLKDYSIYKLYENKNGDNGIVRIANVEPFFSKSETLFIETKETPAPELLKSIYTLVSNYSHYAYNVYDFDKEWNRHDPDMTEEEENEACWLYHVFHKSDGYLTPLALHPYRKSGTINIQQEKDLTEQRLLSLFINADPNHYSFRNIFDKRAIALKFTDPGFSKLQNITLIQYLENTWMNDNSLDWVIDELVRLRSAHINAESYKNILGQLSAVHLSIVQNILDKLMGYDDVAYEKFLSTVNNHIKQYAPHCFPHQTHGQYKGQRSNIANYIYALARLKMTLNHTNVKHEVSEPYLHLNDQKKRYGKYIAYNTIQLARIRLIYQIATFFHIDPYVIFCNYDDMTEYQKCQHYVIYKAISILHKYPDYLNIIKHNPDEEPFEVTDYELPKIFKQFKADIDNESHVTRKLEQALTYINNNESSKDIDYYKGQGTKLGINSNEQHSFTIRLEDLKGEKNYIKLNQLPPAIYEQDIILQTTDGTYVGMDTLSSGEKQVLNNIGAIIYHLQNIDSGTNLDYDSVNLLLEEIELYFHPEYQRQFILLLIRQIMSAKLNKIHNLNITFVTHSPFVLSDIPKCNVLFLRDGKPDYGMQENTFGANIHSLLKNGFFLPNLPMGEFAHEKINELFRRLNEYEYTKKDIEKLKQEISIVGEPYLREQLFKLLRIR